MKNLKRILKHKVFIWCALSLSLSAPLLYYVYKFRHFKVGEPEDFSFFGSYIGGTVGAIIQVINFALLIFIYKQQSKDQEKITQLQYIAYVAPKIDEEVIRRFEEMRRLSGVSLGFNKPKQENTAQAVACLAEFLRKPEMFQEYEFYDGKNPLREEDFSYLQTTFLQYTNHAAYVASLILELRKNKAPAFVYQSPWRSRCWGKSPPFFGCSKRGW